VSALFDMNLYKDIQRGGRSCKDCIHLYRVKYESNRVFNYCKVTVDKKTHNNMKKVRLKDWCYRYEQ
jgi:hypothetical protein